MATAKEYAYYMEGNQIAIVQKDTSHSNGLNYTYQDPPGGLGIGTGTGEWKSPVESVDDGLLIEYTYVPKAKDGGDILDESDEVNVEPYLAKALVYYIKARLAEDTMEIELKEYFMKEFRKMIEKKESGKFNGYRHAVAGLHAIR